MEHNPFEAPPASNETPVAIKPDQISPVAQALITTSAIGMMVWLGAVIFSMYADRDVRFAEVIARQGLVFLGTSLFISVCYYAFKRREATPFILINRVLRGTFVVLGGIIWLLIGLYSLMIVAWIFVMWATNGGD